jgi:hypothetical protein
MISNPKEDRERLRSLVKKALELGGENVKVRTIPEGCNFDSYFKANEKQMIKSVVDCAGWSLFGDKGFNSLFVYEIPGEALGGRMKEKFYLGKLWIPRAVTEVLKPRIVRVRGRYLNGFLESFDNEGIIAHVFARKPKYGRRVFDEDSEETMSWGAIGEGAYA